MQSWVTRSHSLPFSSNIIKLCNKPAEKPNLISCIGKLHCKKASAESSRFCNKAQQILSRKTTGKVQRGKDPNEHNRKRDDNKRWWEVTLDDTNMMSVQRPSWQNAYWKSETQWTTEKQQPTETNDGINTTILTLITFTSVTTWTLWFRSFFFSSKKPTKQCKQGF